jgi:hypothetical protein
MRAIGLDRLLGKPADKRLVPLAIALIASRLISPTSKLATARELAADTAASSLGQLLGLGAVDEVELYRALDWLGARQSAIETVLAHRHLADGALVLYDLSSSWFEGQCCELARFGYSRDGKKGKLQIVYGLLCAANGCPVAVEVFEGNTTDPMTLAGQIDKLKGRFGLSRVVLVGDRGMITSARIRNELKPAGQIGPICDQFGVKRRPARHPQRIAEGIDYKDEEHRRIGQHKGDRPSEIRAVQLAVSARPPRSLERYGRPSCKNLLRAAHARLLSRLGTSRSSC